MLFVRREPFHDLTCQIWKHGLLVIPHAISDRRVLVLDMLQREDHPGSPASHPIVDYLDKPPSLPVNLPTEMQLNQRHGLRLEQCQRLWTDPHHRLFRLQHNHRRRRIVATDADDGDRSRQFLEGMR